MATTGQLIRLARERRGLTQTALAALLDKDRSTISHYELDDVNIPLDEAVRMAKILQVKICQLVPTSDTGEHECEVGLVAGTS